MGALAVERWPNEVDVDETAVRVRNGGGAAVGVKRPVEARSAVAVARVAEAGHLLAVNR